MQIITISNQPYIILTEVARLLAISRQAVNGLLNRYHIKPVKLGEGKTALSAITVADYEHIRDNRKLNYQRFGRKGKSEK